eukprot:3659743-Amphidinium_carterae.1
MPVPKWDKKPGFYDFVDPDCLIFISSLLNRDLETKYQPINLPNIMSYWTGRSNDNTTGATII